MSKSIVDNAYKYYGVHENTPEFKTLIDRYNQISKPDKGYTMTYNDAWCCAFVSLILSESGYGKTYSDSWCNGMYTKMKRYEVSRDKIKVGDIVFYNWNLDGIIDHVGIVTRVYANSMVDVIEGNHNDSVGCRTIDKNSIFITHVIHLPTTKTEVTRVAKEVIKGLWGNGFDRVNKLTLNGYDYSEIQDTVNKMLAK